MTSRPSAITGHDAHAMPHSRAAKCRIAISGALPGKKRRPIKAPPLCYPVFVINAASDTETLSELVQRLLHQRLCVAVQRAVGPVHDPLRAREDHDRDAAVHTAGRSAAGNAEQLRRLDRRLAELAR